MNEEGRAQRVYGISEIAARVYEDRHTVSQWRKRGRLPPADESLASGPVWLAETIEPWIRRNRVNMRLVEVGSYVVVTHRAKPSRYQVAAIKRRGIRVEPVASSLDSGRGIPISSQYSSLPLGDAQILQLENGMERIVRVLEDHGLEALIGPASMRHGNDEEGRDDCTCPGCWRPSVEGSSTGMGFGAGAGPELPEPIPIWEYRCPDCQFMWNSLQFNELARRFA